MERLTFLVEGSGADPYEVVFARQDDGGLRCYCSCPAGMYGQICKHRVRLLMGDVADVLDLNTTDLEILRQWAQGSALAKVLETMVAAEAKVEAAKKELKGAKKALAKEMLG